MNNGQKSFQELLNEQYSFPTDYSFKFVVKKEFVEEVERLIPSKNMKRTASRTGKYISVTSKLRVESSEEVLLTYKKVQDVPGVISL